MTEATVTLASILSDMTTILTSVFTWVGTVMTTIVGNPVLLIFVVGSFALISINVARRLLKL